MTGVCAGVQWKHMKKKVVAMVMMKVVSMAAIQGDTRKEEEGAVVHVEEKGTCLTLKSIEAIIFLINQMYIF